MLPKPNAMYTAVRLAPGDHILLCKGYSDAPAALEERLIVDVVKIIVDRFLAVHMPEVGMFVKHVAITDTD
eukprot:scaffold158755_cov24-Attheya_sp.AAC.1